MSWLLGSRQKCAHNFFISDFSLHSIGVLLLKRNKADVFREVVSDVVTRAGTVVGRLNVNEMEMLSDYAGIFKLDSDDAYQYTLADKYGLKIVSFDADFDRTTFGRSEPSAII
jgi:predicted nucleic acid-binding protein